MGDVKRNIIYTKKGNPVPSEERELIEACRSYDEKAWLKFQRRYKPIMMYVIIETMKRMRCSEGLLHHREDIFQEALLNICTNLKKFEERCSLLMWVRTCTVRIAQHEVRRLLRRDFWNFLDSTLDERESSSMDSPEEIAADKQLRHQLDRWVLEKLSPKGRRYHEYIHRAELSTEEICAREKVSKEVVRAWRKRLRDVIWEQYCLLTGETRPRPPGTRK